MRWVLFAFTVPYAVTVGYGWVILMVCAFAAKDLRWEGTAVLTAEWRPWVEKFWKYSTTLGRGIIYQASVRSAPDGDEWVMSRIQHHEHVHVRQIEDLMLLSFVVGLVVALVTGNWVLGLALWASGGAWQLPNFLTSMARHGMKKGYLGSEHELSAYAQTDVRGSGESWLTSHTKTRL